MLAPLLPKIVQRQRYCGRNENYVKLLVGKIFYSGRIFDRIKLQYKINLTLN